MPGNPDADKAVARLVKYIPGEVISGYIVFSGLIERATKDDSLRVPAAWVLLAIGAIVTPVYLWKMGRPRGVQWWQLAISTVSFLLWAYAFGGLIAEKCLFGVLQYRHWLAALVAGAFSWVIALFWVPTQTVNPEPAAAASAN